MSASGGGVLNISRVIYLVLPVLLVCPLCRLRKKSCNRLALALHSSVHSQAKVCAILKFWQKCLTVHGLTNRASSCSVVRPRQLFRPSSPTNFPGCLACPYILRA